MREHREIGHCSFQDLAEEIPAGRTGDGDQRRIGRPHGSRHAVQNFANSLWRQIQMTGVLAVFDGRLDRLFDLRIDEERRQLARLIQICFHERPAQGLANILGQQDRILGHHRGFAQRFQNGY